MKTCVSFFSVSCIMLFLVCGSVHSKSSYTVLMYSVDDIATLNINNAKVYKAKWGMSGTDPSWTPIGHQAGTSEIFDISSDLISGSNSLRFVLEDTGCCGVELGIEVKQDGTLIFADTFKGRTNGSRVRYDNTILINTYNTPPIIESFKATATSTKTLVPVEFTCIANDLDGVVSQYAVNYGDSSQTESNTTGIFMHAYNELGSFIATCAVIDNDGTEVTSDPISIKVIGFPTIVDSNKFNITYRDFNRDNGVIGNVKSIDMDLNMTESQYGVVTLYRSLVAPDYFTYEFTLSAQGGRDLKDIVFIALLDKRDRITALPLEIKKSDEKILFPASGQGIEFRKSMFSTGNFESYAKADLSLGLGNAALALGGFILGELIGKASPDFGLAISAYDAANSITRVLFEGVSEGLQAVTGLPLSLRADRNKVMPSSQFADDIADFNNFTAYRLVLPIPTSVMSDLDGVRFSIQIQHNSNSRSLPRFYLTWVNTYLIYEQVALELGTKRAKNLRIYDRYIRAAARRIQIFE